MDLPLFAAIERQFSARAYGDQPPASQAWLEKRNNGYMGAVVAWFKVNPGPITARDLAERLGLKLENGVAPRLSELVRYGWLVKGEAVKVGPVSVRTYRRKL